MIDLQVVISFFGWCSIINISILLFSFLFISVFSELAIKVHSVLTGVSPKNLPMLYFQYMGGYKILMLVFNVVPYFALKIMVQ